MCFNNLSEKLKNIDRIPYFDFSQHTTYGLGGKCRAAFYPKNETEVEQVYNELNSAQKQFIVLGRGSNVLVSEKFYDGYVICTDKLNEIHAYTNGNITCGSGVSIAKFLRYCIEHNFTGAEFLAGIPASIGGAAYMNAAAGGCSCSKIITGVKLFDGNFKYLSKNQCNFGNKYSTMRDINCLITRVDFSLMSGVEQSIKSQLKKYITRRESQPLQKSCGCIFKNPTGHSAGKIIDDCNLKGLRLGGAYVSEKHANFIINDNATPTEIYSLIKRVQRLVYEKMGVLLEEEVCYIGDFYETYG